MKKHLLSGLLLILILSVRGQTLYESKYGFSTSPLGTYRVLIVFAEIDYTDCGVTDPYGENSDWLAGDLPTFTDNLFDVDPSSAPVNYISKYFSEMSFGNLQIINDYYDDDVISVPCNDLVTNYGTGKVIEKLDELTDPIETASGKLLSDFDLW